jgi:modulator of FtsH protease HflK
MAEHPHPHSHHEHRQVSERNRPVAGDGAPDAGSRALSEALRSSFVIVRIVMVVLVIVFFGSGLFTVQEGERAVKLRLGKPVGQGEDALLGPGLHWSWPYPIEEFIKIPITSVQTIDSSVGWYMTTRQQELAGTEPPAGPSLNPAADSYALTADGNIVHSRVNVQYRISDPISFIFDFSNASNAVQSAVDNSLLWAASRFTVDQILTQDVIGFRDAVWRRLEALLEQQRIGVVIEQCTVRSIPPRQLRDAFDNVLKAEINRNRVLNEARSYENQVLSRASAQAQARVNAAESDRVRTVAEINSRARQFEELLPRYEANPNLFVQQRMTETFGQVLTNVQDKIFITHAPGQTKELRLLLNREPRRMVEGEQQQGQ